MSEPSYRVFDVEVTQTIRVKLDEAKFTPEFMREFRQHFFPLFSLSDHAEHLAQMMARGVVELNGDLPKEFVEGYGPIGEMGISAEALDCQEEVLREALAKASA